VTAWIGPWVAPEPAWLGIIGLGVLLAGIGVVIAFRLLTLRLEIEEAAVRARWLGGERRYPLVPGPVTRVRLRGENASPMRSRTGWLGWTIGTAVLRGEERVQVVRLAPTATAILVPTEAGRLAIAAASESELIDALSRAARARQRLEELAEALPADEAEPEQPPEAEAEPHVLTGIERAELEERLALERARAEAQAAEAAASGVPAQPAAEIEESAAPDRPVGRWRRGSAGVRIARPRPSAAFVLLPLLGAGAVWLAATLNGRLPEAGTDLGRLTSLGLVLAGPATSVGAIMARAWWPRLVGVVVTSGLAAAVFVGRALLGP
jgi:hypothetical protein